MALPLSFPLLAQDLVLEEIIVTAQKREETLSEAPLTVNVIGGDSIREAAMFQADELSKMTAGIEVRWEGDSNTGVGIRGVGTFSQQTVPPRVATYVDDFFMGSQADAAFAALFDMERVQVLRGPQGTLYGQPSPTGALLLETANPDMENFEGYVSGSFQDPDGYHVEGAISIPLIPNVLSARLAVLSDERETGTTILRNNSQEERNRDAARLKIQFEPSDSLMMRLAYTRMESSDSDTHRVVESITPTAPLQFSAGDRTSIEDAPGAILDVEDNLLVFHLDWDLSWGKFSLMAGNFWADTFSQNDNDRTNLNIAKLDLRTKFKKQVQIEPRLTFNISDTWESTFGLYYQESEAQTDVLVNQQIGAAGVFEIILDIPSATENRAIFTHNVFNISDATTLTAGIRYTEFDNSSSNIIDGNFMLGAMLNVGGDITPGAVTLMNVFPCVGDTSINMGMSPCRVAAASEIDKVTGTLKIQHQFSEALNVYGTIDRGFRPGGPNFDTTGVFQASPEDPTSDLNSYLGETVDSLEIGAKGRLMEGRAEYGAAVFYSIYEDYQINPVAETFNVINSSVTTPQNPAFVNVAEAVQYGIEGEFRMLVNENLSVFASAAFAKVEFTDGIVPCTNPALGALGPANRFNECEADGTPASPQPELFVTLQSEYHTQLDIGEWYVSGLYNFRDDIVVPGDTIGRFASAAYSNFDLFTGIRTDSWDVQVFAKNVFDDDGISARRGTNSFDYNQLTVIPPRTVGVTATYRFGQSND